MERQRIDAAEQKERERMEAMRDKDLHDRDIALQANLLQREQNHMFMTMMMKMLNGKKDGDSDQA
jgi:hypothetical protein